MTFNHFKVPYATENAYTKKVAYFSMEFAVDQPLKSYSGGLGFLVVLGLLGTGALLAGLLAGAELKAVSFYQETVSDIDGRVVKFLAGSTWLLDREIVGVALGDASPSGFFSTIAGNGTAITLFSVITPTAARFDFSAASFRITA